MRTNWADGAAGASSDAGGGPGAGEGGADGGSSKIGCNGATAVGVAMVAGAPGGLITPSGMNVNGAVGGPLVAAA